MRSPRPRRLARLALAGEVRTTMHFAEFGVILMLFLVGLELQPQVLWRMRAQVIGMGGLQVVVTAITIGLLCAYQGFEWQTALVIGLVIVGGLCWVCPPFRIVPLGQAQQRQLRGAFDAPAVARAFWDQKLLPATARAVPIAGLFD